MFCRAEEVTAVLRTELAKQRRPDLVVFSGDATGLGFEVECHQAAFVLGVHDAGMPPGLAVPGNHDYYIRSAEVSGAFEKHFAPWLKGQRVDDHPYPFACRAGHLWLVGVNACTGNTWPWDAGGTVDSDQLGRLARLLAELEPGPRILVTHYPVCRADGSPEKYRHGLRNLAEVVAVAHQGGVGLWLHGHRHEPYRIDDARIAPFPVICAGSATQKALWGWWEYAIQDRHLHAARRIFDPDSNSFREGEEFELDLSGEPPGLCRPGINA